MAYIEDRWSTRGKRGDRNSARSSGKRWRVRYVDPHGRERAKAFAKKSDAEDYLRDQEARMVRGEWVDPDAARTTLGDYYEAWETRQPWRHSTRAAVGSAWRNHIAPTFGRRALGSIRRGDVEAWAAGLPLGGQTARVAMQYLSTMLEAAAADGYIARNPAHRAKKPRAEVSPVVPFTADELDALSEGAPDWFRIAVTLGAAVGLRQGEAAGLTADRVDFLRRTLTVDRQLVTPPSGEPAFAPPKTQRSYRTIPLADVALDELARHIETFGPGRDGLVLHERGCPVRRNTFGRVWRRLRARAGLPGARFHDTRHTYAAVLLSGGVSVAAVAEYMGHSPATLLRVYAHLIPADHDRARNVMQTAFARSSDGPGTDQRRTSGTL